MTDAPTDTKRNFWSTFEVSSLLLAACKICQEASKHADVSATPRFYTGALLIYACKVLPKTYKKQRSERTLSAWARLRGGHMQHVSRFRGAREASWEFIVEKHYFDILNASRAPVPCNDPHLSQEIHGN